MIRANSVFANSGMFLAIPLLITSLAELSGCNNKCDIYGNLIKNNKQVTVSLGGKYLIIIFNVLNLEQMLIGWQLKPESFTFVIIS